jgi:hypothetical protein
MFFYYMWRKHPLSSKTMGTAAVAVRSGIISPARDVEFQKRLTACMNDK